METETHAIATTNVVTFGQYRSPGTGKPVPAGLHNDAVRIREALAAVDAAKLVVDNAGCAFLAAVKAAGAELLVVKAKLEHGQFRSWLKANIKCTPRQATDYMAVAEGWATIEAQIGSSASVLSLRGALRLLRPGGSALTKKSGKKPKVVAPPEVNVETVIAWLATASLGDRRQVAGALAGDTAAMRQLLPKVSPKATAKQIFSRAMGLVDEPRADEALLLKIGRGKAAVLSGSDATPQ